MTFKLQLLDYSGIYFLFFDSKYTMGYRANNDAQFAILVSYENDLGEEL